MVKAGGKRATYERPIPKAPKITIRVSEGLFLDYQQFAAEMKTKHGIPQNQIGEAAVRVFLSLPATKQRAALGLPKASP